MEEEYRLVDDVVIEMRLFKSMEFIFVDNASER
jgi:hypothetical protein